MDDIARATQGDDVGGAPGSVVHWRAVLTPYRSLPPLGFLIVMSVLGVVSFVTGVAFAWMGAWPVLGFFGLDVLVVFIAFKLNYRAGRMVETVEIGQPDVVLTTMEIGLEYARNPLDSRIDQMLLMPFRHANVNGHRRMLGQ